MSLLAWRRELPTEPRIDAERDQQEAARLGVTTAELPPFNSEDNIYPINKARGKGKGKGQGDPGAAMAYMRRLHGDPDYAPVADLADLALGPEGELTPDAGHEKHH